MNQPTDEEVPTPGVMAALQKGGVGASKNGDTYTLSKGDVVEVQILGAYCNRRMLQRFARKFDIPIHLLFNPEFPKLRGLPKEGTSGD